MINFRHPLYQDSSIDWEKWRYTYKGGRPFIDRYLKKLTGREDDDDFTTRKSISYCPAFAKAGINEIKNAIFQRLADVTRHGGSKTYQEAVDGKGRGVNRRGMSMANFIDTEILPELLVMKKVGIYVDMPKLTGKTLKDIEGKHPYLYAYKCEDICSWSYDDDNNLQSCLLKDTKINYEHGLPISTTDRYRKLWLENGKVHVQFYNEKDVTEGEIEILDIPEIPLVILELSDSLLADVADYQIAHLNIASSDLAYIMKGNFPFYTEQVDNRIQSPHLVKTDDDGAVDNTKNIDVGAVHGRTYPINAERPGFIHPSPEPLMASMEKQEQIKKEIRLLIHLAVSNIQPGRMASASSKEMDERSLESGLSCIGLQLQYGENQIARFWEMYERLGNVAVIKYPDKYSLKSQTEKNEEAESLSKQAEAVPSLTFKKEMAKQIAEIHLGNILGVDKLNIINKEIDDAPAIITNIDTLHKDTEVGICSLETASKIRCYPPGETEKAAKDHQERLERIAATQTEGIRGVTGGDTDTTKKDRDQTGKDKVTDNTRGKGK